MVNFLELPLLAKAQTWQMNGHIQAQIAELHICKPAPFNRAVFSTLAKRVLLA